MSQNNRTIIKTIFLAAFTLIILFNVSYGQSKTDKIDELMSAFAEYGEFNGAVLVAEKGNVIYKKDGFNNCSFILIHNLFT